MINKHILCCVYVIYIKIIKDKTTLFFKNKAEAFRKNYSINSAKYVHVKNTTFIYKKLLQYEI